MSDSVKNRKNSTARKKWTSRCTSKCRARSGFNPSKKGKYAFLTEQINEILAVNLPDCDKPFRQVSVDGKLWWKYCEYIEIDAEANIDYMIDCVKAYCTIYKVEFYFTRSNNPLSDLNKLYQIAASVAPEDHIVALDYSQSREMVILREYILCEFDYNTLFFLPVSFVERLPEDLKDIAKKALSVFIHRFDLSLPEDHFDMSFALGIWDDGENLKELEEQDPEAYKDRIEIVNSYREGDIYNLIKDCCVPVYDTKELREEIENLYEKYKESQYGNLLKSFLDGLDLSKEYNWHDFTRTPDTCGIDDFAADGDSMLELCRLFAVVYDLMDEVVEIATDCLNGEASSLSMDGFYDSRDITPNTIESMVPSDFLKRWALWFSSLVDIIFDLK